MQIKRKRNEPRSLEGGATSGVIFAAAALYGMKGKLDKQVHKKFQNRAQPIDLNNKMHYEGEGVWSNWIDVNPQRVDKQPAVVVVPAEQVRAKHNRAKAKKSNRHVKHDSRGNHSLTSNEFVKWADAHCEDA